MPVNQVRKIFDLELEIIQKERGHDISVEEARKFQSSLISLREEFLKSCPSYEGDDDGGWKTKYQELQYNFLRAECIQKKTIHLLGILEKIIEPVESTSSTKSEVNNQTIENLDSLLQKQKFYTEMIDSLAPEREISAEEAQVRYEHVVQAYEKFTSNQSKLMTFVKDSAFEDQVKIFKDMQLKVISFQESLKKMISPSKPKILPILPKIKAAEQFTQPDRLNVNGESLDLLFQKQKFFVTQIEQIESKSKTDLSVAEAETFHNYVSLIYDSFVRNQAKIETCVTGCFLDKELELSRVLLQKVMSVQIKLKEIIAPVSPFPKESDKVTYLNALSKRQQSMVDDIESMYSLKKELFALKSDQPLLNPEYTPQVKSSFGILPKLKDSFVLNHSKIIDLLSDDYDIQKQSYIFTQNLGKIVEMLKLFENYISLWKLCKA